MKNAMFVLYSGVLASAILLTACGTGSGGVTSSPSGAAAAPAAAAGGAIEGVAAKGILSKAIVTAYCGNSEAAADQLATGATDAAGKYSLTWTTACANKPLKLVVTGDANTTMADEATGTNVTPPAGFKLRALVADPDITTTKNITPFTDMAAAIAGTSATLSKTAASNAETAIINNVLGGAIGVYQATPLAPTAAAMATASADEKQLATLLTVISAFAEDSTTTAACGSLTGGTGAKIQCALNAFATQAMATVTAVTDAGYTVATILPTNTPATMLSTTLTKITTAATTGTTTGTTTTSLITATGTQTVSPVVTADTSGSAAILTTATSTVTTASTSTAGTVVVAAASGVQAARDLFNSLKNDLFALSNSAGTGFLDQKVSAMNADFTSIASTSATASTENIKALKRALDFAYEAKTAIWTTSGTLAANTVYRVTNGNVVLETDGSAAPLRFLRSFSDGMNCYVQSSDKTLGKAGCYFSNGQPNVTINLTTFTGFYHAVEVAESTPGSGTYTWQDFMASRTYSTSLYINPTFYPINGNGGNIATTAQVITSTQQTGTAVMAWDSAGNITSGTVKGNIQPLVTGQDYSTLDITGMSSSISGTSEISSISGTVTNVKGTATTLTMALQSGSQFVDAPSVSTIGLPGLVSVAITPATASIPISAAQQFVTTATYSDGSTRDVTASSSWTSGTSGVATVNSTSGVATGVAAGTSVITATFLGRTAAATLTVTTATLQSLAPTTTTTVSTTTTTTVATATLPAISGHPISGKLIVQLKTAAFQYDGTLTVDTFTKDLSMKDEYVPTNASFIGKISTLANGTATEFLSGTLGVTLANMAAYDHTQPTSATNFLKQTASFSGKATNGSTTYEFTFIVDGSTFGQESITLNYSRAGSQMISVTGTKSATTNTLTIHGSGDVNAVLTNGIGDVNTGTTRVGSITKNPSQVNFTDGTFLLLGG
jgi:hypothetical protein